MGKERDYQEEWDEYYRQALQNQPRIGLLTPLKPPKPPPPPPPPPPTIQDPVGTLRIRVVEDSTGKPVPNVKFCFFSDSIPPITTNAQGIAEGHHSPGGRHIAQGPVFDKQLTQVWEFVGEGEVPIYPASSQTSPAAPATSPVDQPPTEQVIAHLKRYKVKTGDTLTSIGRQHGFGMQLPGELAYFNWGVTSHQEIQQKLREVVGCTKTDSDGNYIFDDSDYPGIIFLPQPWEMEGVTIYQMPTLRVRHPLKESTSVSIVRVLLWADGKPRVNKPYTLELPNGQQKQGKTTSEGYVQEEVPLGTPSVIIRIESADLGMEEYLVKAEQLSSLDTDSGAKQRLRHLGFSVSTEDDWQRALYTFQMHYSLPPSRELDHSTKQKIQEVHGS